MSAQHYPSSEATGGTLKVTLVKSLAGRLKNHQASVRGLGIRRIHQSVEVKDTAENRGMINAAHYLLRVEDAAAN
jgi:large subunit ribosomal protein L30